MHHQMIEEQFNNTHSRSKSFNSRKSNIVGDLLTFVGNHLINFGDALLKLSKGFSYSTR
jgi:hypothetical protein